MILAVSIATIAAGVESTGGALRVDYIFYGRYNDALVPTLLALGVSALFEPRARRWVPQVLAGAAVGIGLLGLATVALRRGISYTGLHHPLTMPALDPFLGIGPRSRVESPFVAPVTIGAVVVAALLALLAKVRPAAVTAVLLLGFAWIAYKDVVPASRTITSNDAASPVYRALRERRPATVAYDIDQMAVNTYYGLPFWLDDSAFVAFRASGGAWPEADLYVGPAAWPAANTRGLQLLTVDPITKQGYWVPD